MKKLLLPIILIVSILISTKPIIAQTPIAFNGLPEENAKGASMDNYNLFVDEQTGKVSLEDKRNGYIWSSSVDEDTFNLDNVAAVWKKQMTSMFNMNYVRFELTSNVQKKVSSCDADTIDVKKINSGVIATYGFKKLGIQIEFHITLKNDVLTIRIPSNAIKETENHGVISIELMPFFGAADKHVDGYILYPDGCGALLKYQNRGNKPLTPKTHTWSVYGPMRTSHEEFMEMEKNQRYHAMFPLFGVKNEENAFLAVITEGEANANINLSPEGNVVNLNRTFFEIFYRNSFDIVNSNLAAGGGIGSDSVSGIKFDRTLAKQDYEIKYMFLNGDGADYSGMANVYREYMVESDQLTKVIDEDGLIPLAVDYFMGIKEKRLLMDKYIVMTTYEEALTITRLLQEKGVQEIQMGLKGWTSGGYGVPPNIWPPERRLGGKTGLTNLANYANDNGIKIFLQTDFIKASSKGGGFSKRNDVVKTGNNLVVTNPDKDWFLLSAAKVLDKFTNLNKKLKNFSVGIGFDKVGEVIYKDYNKNSLTTRVDTQETWELMLEKAKQDHAIAVEGGNSYVLKHAERLYHIPDKTTGYDITDEEVPFFQMVVHGMIPYTFTPGNLTFSSNEQKLRWIEYGYMPYYELTYNSSEALKYTSYNGLFTSRYNNWIDEAVKTYIEFNENLGLVWGEKMIMHTKINEYLFKTCYSNGAIVYVNYDDDVQEHDGYRINGMDYLVIEGGV